MRRPPVARRYAVLSLFVLGYFGVRFVEFALSVVFADLKDDLGVSAFVVGLAVAASTVTYAAVQLPSGALGDRFGERRVVLAALGLTGIASALLSLSPSGLGLVLGMAAVGLVSGAYYSPATALLTDLFEGTGRTIGVHRLGAQAVGVTGPLVALVAAGFGWRAVLLLSAAVVVPALVGISLLVAPRESSGGGGDASARSLTPGTVRELLSRPPVAFATGVAAFAQFADTAAFSFLPLLLREYHDLAPTLAGALFSGYFLAVTASQPAAGWLSDRVGRDAVTTLALVVGSVGCASLLVRDSLIVVVAAVGCLGRGMGWGPPVQSRLLDHLGPDERGVGFGLVRTVYIGLAALNGVVVGWVATRWGWGAGIAVIAAALAVPAVALLVNAALGSAR